EFRKNRLPRWKIRSESGFHCVAERNVALLLALATNQDGFRAQTNVTEVDSDQFRIANAASVEQFQHQSVALREGCYLRHLAIEHEIHFFYGRNARQFLGQLRRR